MYLDVYLSILTKNTKCLNNQPRIVCNIPLRENQRFNSFNEVSTYKNAVAIFCYC